MPKIMLTGSNGLLGQKLQVHFWGRKTIELIPTCRGENRFPFPKNFPYETLDITDPARTRELIERHRPDVLINAAAMTNVNLCESKQEECWKVNVRGVENLIRSCRDFGVHLIHISTDFVFDGQAGPYREEDKTSPVNFYGKSKEASEQLIEASGISWAILRTILVYGYARTMPSQNLVLLVKNKLEKKENLRIVNDQLRMPTFAEDLAAACMEASLKKARGIFHVSGNQMVSIYDFARLIAKTFHLDETLIHPTDSVSLAEPARRPPKTGFYLDKASKILSYSPRPIEEGLSLVKRQIQPQPAL
jgi:dTDP-4-dehydrorhamnose reductase